MLAWAPSILLLSSNYTSCQLQRSTWVFFWSVCSEKSSLISNFVLCANFYFNLFVRELSNHVSTILYKYVVDTTLQWIGAACLWFRVHLFIQWATIDVSGKNSMSNKWRYHVLCGAQKKSSHSYIHIFFIHWYHEELCSQHSNRYIQTLVAFLPHKKCNRMANIHQVKECLSIDEKTGTCVDFLSKTCTNTQKWENNMDELNFKLKMNR